MNSRDLTNKAACECSASEHAPLHSLELATSKVRSHTWSRHNGSSCSSSSQSHGQTKGGPAALSTEKLFLIEQVTIGSLNDLISGLILSGVIGPSTDEGLVEMLLTLPDGA